MIYCKRFADILFSAIGLLLSAPIMLLIAVVVYIDSPGSVIFSQKRLGRHGIPFHMHKFRKFPVSWDNSGPNVTAVGDLRMTPVGKFLERTKLDELPQLWNILLGQMSFVGPRPESMHWVNEYREKFEKIFQYTPGLFGPNQVAFRNEAKMYPPDEDPDKFYANQLLPIKLKNDIEYFAKANCLSDAYWVALGLWHSIVGSIPWKYWFANYGTVILIDLIAIQMALLGANIVRFGLPGWEIEFAPYMTSAWLFPIIVIPCMILGGAYRHPNGYFGVPDLFRLVAIVVVTWFFSSLIEIGFFHRNMSIAICFISLLLVIPSTLFPRIWRGYLWRFKSNKLKKGSHYNLLIYGAGRHGAALSKFLKTSFPSINIIGFVDNNNKLRNKYIEGIKVLGSERDLNMITNLYSVDEFWVSLELGDRKYNILQNWATENNIKFVDFYAFEHFEKLRSALA